MCNACAQVNSWKMSPIPLLECTIHVILSVIQKIFLQNLLARQIHVQLLFKKNVLQSIIKFELHAVYNIVFSSNKKL